jgi:glycosyltransferase involved in cell wall biosynthesis
MKLIIQIPCYNEEETLPATIRDLPKEIDGIDTIELQVIDDGSTDNTALVAEGLNVDHIIRFKQNKGLAAAFEAGQRNALKEGAHILVNTDADNQYVGGDIVKLVKPILGGSADIVIGCRPIEDHEEFSFLKKKLQRAGSWVLRKASRTTVRDAASGFRAYSREALTHLNIFSEFSYTMETLIGAGYHNLKIESVDIGVNAKTRESRLFRNLPHYLWKSGTTIINIFLLYRSSPFFSLISASLVLVSLLLAARFLYLVLGVGADSQQFWPSVILAGVLLLAGFFVYLTGILSWLIASNRKLSEDILYRTKRLEERHNEIADLASLLKDVRDYLDTHPPKDV